MKANGSMIQRRALGLALAGGAMSTGCFGSFGLSKAVYDWNDSFGSKWVKWLVFLGMNIIPVYGIVLTIDALILNSIEFWLGSHPVSGSTRTDGRRVASRQTKDPNVVRHDVYEGQRHVATVYLRRDGENGASLLNANGRTLTRVQFDGSTVSLMDTEDRIIAQLDDSQCRRAAVAIRSGASAHEAVFDELASSRQMNRIRQAAATNDWDVSL